MNADPASWTALCALALLVGLRQGFYAEHVQTIRGLAHCYAGRNRYLARAVGAVVCLGHGAVMLAVAWVVAALCARWRAPPWLNISGPAVYPWVLFAFGFLNVRAVRATPPAALVACLGIRARLLRSVLSSRTPWAAAATGMLLGFSLDTLSQAALVALAGSTLGGITQALFANALVVVGMLLVHVKRSWLRQLIRRSDDAEIVAPRMAFAVVAASLALGAVMLTSVGSRAFGAWLAASEPWVTLLLIVAVVATSLAPMRAARRHAALRIEVRRRLMSIQRSSRIPRIGLTGPADDRYEDAR